MVQDNPAFVVGPHTTGTQTNMETKVLLVLACLLLVAAAGEFVTFYISSLKFISYIWYTFFLDFFNVQNVFKTL